MRLLEEHPLSLPLPTTLLLKTVPPRWRSTEQSLPPTPRKALPTPFRPERHPERQHASSIAPTVTPTVGFSAPGNPNQAPPTRQHSPKAASDTPPPPPPPRNGQNTRNPPKPAVFHLNGYITGANWPSHQANNRLVTLVAYWPPPVTCGAAGAPHRAPHSNEGGSTFAGRCSDSIGSAVSNRRCLYCILADPLT